MNIRYTLRINFLISFLLLLLFLPGLGYAQGLVLSSPMTTGDHSSRYSVKLAPGFSTTGPFRAFIVPQTVNTVSRGALVDEVIKVEGVKADAQIYALDINQRQTTKTFLDGFGRPTQQILVKGSPGQKDIIQSMAYDNLGMQTKSYLPYASADGSGNFHADAMNEQIAFYSNGTSDKVADDSKPYSEQVFENSPLQRIMTAGGVGAGFQPGEHSVSISYRTNLSTETIHRWNPDGTAAADYSTGDLSVVTSTDQQGNQTVIYKDLAGNVILKKQQLDGTVAWVDTYYVYDDFRKPRFVIPPKAVAAMQSANNWSLTQNGMGKLLFNYVYDNKGRVVERTVPGGAVTYMVYDPLDRLVLAQDGNLRAANQWNYIKYDSRNVPVSQGIYTNTDYTSRTSMQANVSGLNYTTYFEERNTDPNTGYYTNVSFPSTAIEPLAYSYFSDYDLDGNGAADYSYQVQGLSGETTAVSNIRGMPTMVRKRTIGAGLSNIWLTSVTFYDRRGAAIQTLSNNQLNASVNTSKTVVSDFTGKILRSKTVQVASVTTNVVSEYSYDHADRMKTVDESYNGAAAVRLAAYEYNELGQLVDKKLHSLDNGSNYLQSVDFRYNIHGNLTSINNSTLSLDSRNDDSNDVFGMEILYEQSESAIGNTAYYNGMISAVKWKVNAAVLTTGNERSYKFSYDKMMRLQSANYSDRSGSGNWNSNGGFDEKQITYDLNGNILTLQRNAILNGTVTAIDDLSYSYDGNRLNNVTDGSGGSYGTYGFKNLTGSLGAYNYDINGNLVTDSKKGLSLEYNSLNRTSKVTMTASVGRYINYTYDADGHLIRKQSYDNSVIVKTTDYIGGFVYENNVLQYFGMAEGRIRNAAGTLTPEYMIKDQQGNVRVSFESQNGVAVVRQENGYYPYGLVMPGGVTPTDANKKLHNGGSEWQNDFSDLPDLNQTFYRNYDAALGRFIGVDPMAESSESMTTYQYAFNNPIMFNDPLGDVAQANSIFEIIDKIDRGGAYGGSWSSSWGYSSYGSNYEAFMYGAAQMQSNGSWGGGGTGSHAFASDYNQAAYRYNMSFPNGRRAEYSSSGYIGVTGSYYHDSNGVGITIGDLSGDLTVFIVGGKDYSITPKTVNKKESQPTDWGGVINSGFGIVGGAAEVALGAVTTEFGIGVFGIVDGSARVLANSVRLSAYLSGNKELGDAAPSNLGAFVGKLADGNPDFYKAGRAQLILGTFNDGITMALTGTTWSGFAIKPIAATAGLFSDVYTTGFYYNEAVK